MSVAEHMDHINISYTHLITIIIIVVTKVAACASTFTSLHYPVLLKHLKYVTLVNRVLGIIGDKNWAQ